MQKRPTSNSWRKHHSGMWVRDATAHDTENVPRDAYDGYGCVLAGSPEEADRIDDEAFGPTIGAIVEDAAKGACMIVVCVAIAFVAVGMGAAS